MINRFQASSKGLLAGVSTDISNVLEHRLNIISITLGVKLHYQTNHNFLDGSILSLEL